MMGSPAATNSPIYIETKTQHKSALDKVSLGHETPCLNEFAERSKDNYSALFELKLCIITI